jgi:type III pantothenate kinase
MSKLLIIDAGNTNIVLGLYENDTLVHNWRIHTDRQKLVDEYGELIGSLLAKHDIRLEHINEVAVSNVVPSLQVLLENLVKKYFRVEPFFVSTKNILNMTVKIDNPDELGADLIAAAVAAIEKYGTPCIILDLGTATTLTVVNEKSEFVGGAIAPGLSVSCEALYNCAPHLPRIKMESPPSIIGTNTIHCMQAGMFSGYAHMIEGLVGAIRKEIGEKTKVVATGGLAGVLGEGTSILDVVDSNLVLDGIRLLYKLNRNKQGA